LTVRVNDRDLALVRCTQASLPHVVDNRCPHRGGQLGDGYVQGENIVCALHGYDYDLHSGISRFDTSERIAVYPVRVHRGEIQVDADEVPALPVAHDEGYLAQWARPKDAGVDHYGYLQALRGGAPPVSAMATELPREPQWSNILLMPGQLARRPLLADEPVSLSTTIGRRAERPLQLELPFFVSHMSFGALSASAKQSLAQIANQLGTAIGSGEGGMLDAEREAAGDRYIFEMASGYFGWDDEHIARANAVEIKIGQSAKAGSGGLLPADKVTPEIAEVRGLAPGEAAHSPARFTDINSTDDLAARVAEIRKHLDGAPVGIKFAAGRIEEDLDVAMAIGVDFVTIDGRGGGTGAAPNVLKDNLTIPIQYALHRARRHLRQHGVSDLDIVATGNFRTAGDIAKALAMGANAVALATASMIAIGCQQYLACHTGNCPVGIATQRKDLEARLDVDLSTERGMRTLGAMRDELLLLARATGVSNIHDLDVDDLATLDSEIAAHTDIRHA
jgi:glutamate synthase domain-containing protein 2/nitrite reductase/ring-hydroxylating ferredoxin subunit